MPSLKAIRRRIASVKNTQKITKAMKSVAAARLRKAQEAILALRPYSQRLGEVIAEVAARSGGVHPLLEVREPKRVALVVLTSDRGLCGGFNANINRRAERFLKENREKFADIELNIVGRKGREYFRRRGYTIHDEYMGVFAAVSVERAREITTAEIEDYTKNQLDAVYLVYNEFKSAMSQKVVVERLLPVEPLALPAEAGQIDYKYEPEKRKLLDHLLPLYVETQIYRAILESIASEFGAKMTAMDNATNNANEMIGMLTLQYNRARQAAITKELMEIVGGAEALKG
ncbi:MAG TPA: ATP synthase F1 subunit gamma [Polyangia bacterium]|nr:ATP synthase F1 subunit gamma [Polyangia bacterium]